MKYDVIVVGAGPGGSSAAAFLADAGCSVLLLDKAEFPRDKVCGDGLTPQAIYWLDRLGCVDEVLGQTHSCIKSADLFINGEYSLTGGFPQNTGYPGFGVCLERYRLDHLLVKHAVSRGAIFKSGHRVQSLSLESDGIVSEVRTKCGTDRFCGSLLIGADGAGSLVSRYLGNTTPGDIMGLYLRAYYANVNCELSPFKLFLNESFFPGYGWIFTDDRGFANVGFGYIRGRGFPMKRPLRSLFDEFVGTDGGWLLEKATPCGPADGWWESFSTPALMAMDRVMLVGDAGRCADPMNGAGIHKAIESAWIASRVAIQSIRAGDFSHRSLSVYEQLLNINDASDRAVSEIFINIVKNPGLRELYFRLLRGAVRLSGDNDSFRDFCCGIFSGTIPQRACLSIDTLMQALPNDPCAWLEALALSKRNAAHGLLNEVCSIVADVYAMSTRVAKSPSVNLRWAVEIMDEALELLVGSSGKADIRPLVRL